MKVLTYKLGEWDNDIGSKTHISKQVHIPKEQIIEMYNAIQENKEIVGLVYYLEKGC